MNDYIKSDLMRYYGRFDTATFCKAYIESRTFRFQCALRLSQSNGLEKIIGLVLWKINRTKMLIQIPRKTKIGYGLYIGHGGPVVVNKTAVIGNNVTIGAGSVVTKDIPDNATAVGNYAKVIHYNEPGRFVNRRWTVEN